jgi:tRNA pseudouridine55 synthase
VFEAPEPGVIRIDVECSSGTYIRTLAADLGHLLGGGAHLRNLRRVASGGFGIDEAQEVDGATLRPMLDALRGFPIVAVDEATATMVRNGRVLPRFAGEGPWAVVDPQGELLAVYEPYRHDEAKPAVVIPVD